MKMKIYNKSLKIKKMNINLNFLKLNIELVYQKDNKSKNIQDQLVFQMIKIKNNKQKLF